MEKIVIIGSPGAGKTTLANEIHSKLKMKVYHLDRLFWQPGWIRKTRDTRIDILQKIVQEKQWIIEGSYFKSSESRLDAADTIIFLDIAPLECLRRIIKRHFEAPKRSRRDVPYGCTSKLTLFLLFKVLFYRLLEGKQLEECLLKFPEEKIKRLHSTTEIEYFLARLSTEEKRPSFMMSAVN